MTGTPSRSANTAASPPKASRRGPPSGPRQVAHRLPWPPDRSFTTSPPPPAPPPPPPRTADHEVHRRLPPAPAPAPARSIRPRGPTGARGERPTAGPPWSRRARDPHDGPSTASAPVPLFRDEPSGLSRGASSRASPASPFCALGLTNSERPGRPFRAPPRLGLARDPATHITKVPGLCRPPCSAVGQRFRSIGQIRDHPPRPVPQLLATRSTIRGP
jgi:hypothetical protein